LINNSKLAINTYPILEGANFYSSLLEQLDKGGESFSVVCSTLEYTLAAVAAKRSEREFFLVTTEDAAGAFLLLPTPTNRLALLPAETGWGFSSNLFGNDPTGAIELLVRLAEKIPDLIIIYLTGVTPSLKNELLKGQKKNHPFIVKNLGKVESVVANIENGIEGVLQNVSNNKRKNFKKALRFANELSFEYIKGSKTPELVWQRLLAVEKQSWKWLSNQSIFQSPQQHLFYHELFQSFNAKNFAHILFVQHNSQDIAYVFGASYLQAFRGFQTSFIASKELALLSPGNNGHLYLMDILSKAGILTYNFGSVMDYKLNWSKDTIVTENLELILMP